MKPPLVYLASPYSHPDPAVRGARFQDVCRAAAHLMRGGLYVFSPIAHSHPIALTGALPTNWEYWKAYDETMISSCRALAVLKLNGWDESRGVREEVEIARKLGLTTYYTGPQHEHLDLLARVIKEDLEEKPDTTP